MGKKLRMLAGVVCYVLGIVGSVYVGGWIMFLQPIHVLYDMAMAGTLTLSIIASCGIRILLSTTFAGLVWCVGYIGYNYFKGTEDPDWDAMNERVGERN